MKTFTKEEIDRTRSYCVKQGMPELELKLAGREFSYFVMPASLNTDLPNYVYRATGVQSDGYCFGVDERMPERLRPYALLEEYIEFIELGMEKENRVIDSENEVISLIIDETLRQEYVLMRRDFFRNLLIQNEKRPELYLFTDDDVVEFKKNLSMLEEKAQSYEGGKLR